MLCSSKKQKITKIIGSGQTEFMMHTMSKPSVTNYKRGVKCTYAEVMISSANVLNTPPEE